jgi:integrase
MASIFKRGKDKKDRNAPWLITYKGADGRRQTTVGYRDKEMTKTLAAQLEDEARQRRNDPRQARMDDERGKPIAEHVTDFERSLRNRGCSETYLIVMLPRLQKIIDGCEFATVGDIIKSKVEVFLAELSTEKKLGPKTHNHYVSAIITFCQWLKDDNRIPVSPVEGLAQRNEDLDVRHARRALTVAEFDQLFTTTRASMTRREGLTGIQRAVLYLFAFSTGLRKNEIAGLTARQFILDGSQPAVIVPASLSKHRQEDRIPLHPDLIPLLNVRVRGLDLDDRVFPEMTPKIYRALRKDLEDAGIAYKDTDGRFADFHSLRHSFITGVLRSGASVIQARELARHNSVEQTMRYSHVEHDEQAEVLAMLPIPKMNLDGSAQRRRSAPCVREVPQLTLSVINCLDESATENDDNPHGTEGYVSESALVSATVSDCLEWRRRDSNPEPAD